MNILTKSPITECSINATIIRASGYKENLGRLAYWNKSLLKRLDYTVQHLWKKLPNGMLVYVPILVAAPHNSHLTGLIDTLPLLPFFLGVFQVNTGRALVTNNLAGTADVPVYAGWGTSSTAAAQADTTLGFETFSTTNDGTHNLRATGTGSQQTTSTTHDTYRNIATLTAAQNQNATQGTLTGPIYEQGLFDTNGQAASLLVAPSGGVLFLHGSFGLINLSTNDSIQFTDSVQYS